MPVYWGIYKSKIKENKSKDGVEGFSCILREPQRSFSNTGGQGGGVVKLPPGFHGNAEADYSDASFTVNSCSVSIKPLTVPCFFFLWDFRERQQSLKGLGHWEDRIIIRRYDGVGGW